MKKTVFDFWVGLFVAIGFLAILFLALKAGNMSSFSFSKTYTIVASFDNIGGLKPRAPIKSAGVVVGRVAAIEFDDFLESHSLEPLAVENNRGPLAVEDFEGLFLKTFGVR